MLTCLFLQCSVNTVVTPHSHILNLTSVSASNRACIATLLRLTAHSSTASVGLPCASTAEMNFLNLKADYPCSDDVHCRLQALGLSVVPDPLRSLSPRRSKRHRLLRGGRRHPECGRHKPVLVSRRPDLFCQQDQPATPSTPRSTGNLITLVPSPVLVYCRQVHAHHGLLQCPVSTSDG